MKNVKNEVIVTVLVITLLLGLFSNKIFHESKWLQEILLVISLILVIYAIANKAFIVKSKTINYLPSIGIILGYFSILKLGGLNSILSILLFSLIAIGIVFSGFIINSKKK